MSQSLSVQAASDSPPTTLGTREPAPLYALVPAPFRVNAWYAHSEMPGHAGIIGAFAWLYGRP